MSIVRTAYAFSPTSISNCALWLDGSKESGTDGSTLTTITDRTNSGNSLIASGTISIASSYLGGLTVYNFGNSRAYANNFPWQTSFTQIVLVKCSLGNWLSSLWGSGTYQAYVYSGNWNLEYIPSFGANDSVISQGTSVFTSTADGTTAWTIFSLGYQSGATTASNYSLNGTVRTSQTGTASSVILPTNAQLWLNGNGNNSFDTSYVAELIHYNIVLTDSQRQQVEGYLAQKWGLTSSLSTGHPGLTSRIYRSDYLVPNKVKPVPYYVKFLPTQIAGCIQWLDGADNSTIYATYPGTLATNGATVTQWNDKSLAKNHVYQNASSTCPTFTLASNALNFAGGGGLWNSVGYALSSNVSFFTVMISPGTGWGTWGTLWGHFRSGGHDADIQFRQESLTNGYVSWHTNNNNNNYLAIPTAGTKVMYSCTMSNGVNMFLQNSYSGSTTSSTYTEGSMTIAGGTVAPFWVGRSDSSEVYNGYICEIIYYNQKLSDAQRQQVESYLAQKWGLITSLSGGHSHFTQQAGAITTTALSKYRIVGLPRVVFASTGLAITHQDGRVWKISGTGQGASMGLNTGTAMSLTIYAGSDVYNSAGGRVGLFDNGNINNAVRHAGYVMWTYTFVANNYDFGWYFVSSGSGYLIYNDYPSIGSAWQATYDPSADRVLIVAPGDAKYGMVWNVTPKVTLAYVHTSYP